MRRPDESGSLKGVRNSFQADSPDFCKRESFTRSPSRPSEADRDHRRGEGGFMLLVLGDILPAPASAPSPSTIRSARSRNRAAAWAYDLGQWRRYRLSRETSVQCQAEIEAEYARLLAAGPDFAAYHTGSAFVDPPMHRLTREDRIRVLATFDTIRATVPRRFLTNGAFPSW